MGSARSLEERIGDLEEQLGALRLRLEKVEAGKSRPQLQPGTAAAIAAVQPPVSAEAPAAAPLPAATRDGEGGIAGWAGTSALLPRVSTVSFLLVVALALRTLTDSGVIGPRPAPSRDWRTRPRSWSPGWVLYLRRSVLAPVFAVCGAVLLCSIVVETHIRFAALGTAAAFTALGATGLFLTLLGERGRTALPGVVGVLGISLAGIALTVSHQQFAPLLALLLGASLLAIPVSRRLRGDWIGWTLFALSSLRCSSGACASRSRWRRTAPRATLRAQSGSRT